MKSVVTTKTSKLIDRHMICDIGIDGMVLMENAARGVANAVMHCGRMGECVILIGGGNNGGDGLALMRILKSLGRSSVGILVCDPNSFSGDALKNYNIALRLGLPITNDLDRINSADIIVDAVFGTGLSRPIEGSAYSAILLANQSKAYRISVDIPSGINGDTGEIMGIVFNADETITFQCIKQGLLLTKELEAVGRLTVFPIGVTDADFSRHMEKDKLLDIEFIDSLLPKRKLVSNKGTHGHALIIAGSRGMSGAAVMSAAAALRGGAGLTRAYVPAGIIPAFSSVPEVMPIADTDEEQSLSSLLTWANAVGIGCGMGNDPMKHEKLLAVLSSGKHVVIDADGLNIMNEETLAMLGENCILTPHPGEMARLIGTDINTVLRNTADIARAFAVEHNCTVVVKSAVSVIASADGRLRYNLSGNTGLAKGGSGDVLTGIITALLVQGLDPFDAASAGAFLLGCSANNALTLLKTRTLAAMDVVDAISQTIIGLPMDEFGRFEN